MIKKLNPDFTKIRVAEGIGEQGLPFFYLVNTSEPII
jgi:hypothetical protein